MLPTTATTGASATMAAITNSATPKAVSARIIGIST